MSVYAAAGVSEGLGQLMAAGALFALGGLLLLLALGMRTLPARRRTRAERIRAQAERIRAQAEADRDTAAVLRAQAAADRAVRRGSGRRTEPPRTMGFMPPTDTHSLN